MQHSYVPHGAILRIVGRNITSAHLLKSSHCLVVSLQSGEHFPLLLTYKPDCYGTFFANRALNICSQGPDQPRTSSKLANDPPSPRSPCLSSHQNNVPHPKDILDVIPRIMIPPGLVLREGVISDIDGRSAPDALLLTAAEKYADHHPQMAPVATDSAIGRHGQGGAVVAGEDTQYWVRHRRDWQEVDRFGFRRYDA